MILHVKGTNSRHNHNLETSLKIYCLQILNGKGFEAVLCSWITQGRSEELWREADRDNERMAISSIRGYVVAHFK
jgi:hypothetical protein